MPRSLNTLSPPLRKHLERTVVKARDAAEAGARAALEALAVHERAPYRHLAAEQRALRTRLRAHGRQLGDRRHARAGTQAVDHLAHECAYEHWHGMLFARFLADNHLLIDPQSGVAVTLDECAELAQEEGLDRWALAARFAHRMLPQVFRPDHPAFAVRFAREHRLALERLVEELPEEVFGAADAVGWVYQFWQTKRKEQVNRAEIKIGADELPAVTQLFTEPYMVHFLLDNTLGAWWAARRLDASDLQDAAHEADLRRTAALPGAPLDYLRFVRAEEQAEGPAWRPAAGAFAAWPQELRALRVLDPCCGSGHFLVAAFAMLVPMRMALEGLDARAAVEAVLRDSLYGLELDPRCVQLAAFALALAAWRYPGAGGYRPLPELHLACSGSAPNAPRGQWIALAEQAAAAAGMPAHRDLFGVDASLLSEPLRNSLAALHELFSRAPELGSLIAPRALQPDLFQGDYETVRESFSAALAPERAAAAEQNERVVAAQGMARAAELLAGSYHLVVTNVPYLARGKQAQTLRDFCERYHAAAKNDLATVFLERCLALCAKGGTASLVLPQNWLFLTSYRKLREKLLKTETWHLLARLGPGAFETISGEVVKAVLLTLSRGEPAVQPEPLEDWAARLVDQIKTERGDDDDLRGGRGLLNLELGLHEAFASLREQVMQRVREDAARASSPRPDDAAAPGTMYGLDVAAYRTAAEKATRLRESDLTGVEQSSQLENPDARISFEVRSHTLLGTVARSWQGIVSSDDNRFVSCIWEICATESRWERIQLPPQETIPFTGLSAVIRWEHGAGVLHHGSRAHNFPSSAMLDSPGVAFQRMREINATLFGNCIFADHVAPVIPTDDENVAAIWCYANSSEYREELRKVDSTLKAAVGSFVKVPFDLDRWAAVANKRYPNGLPHPYSDDPTQWIFHGHPCGSVVWDEAEKCTADGPLRTDPTVLHIAVARLVGYRWPAERDVAIELADEQRVWVRRCAALHLFADDDGIVCLPPVRGEPPAAERLLRLLTAAYGEAWNEGVLGKLVAASGSPSLDEWLRNRFFEQHSKLFHHRPFVWHVWDGRRHDGFHALVDYHRLAEADGKGRRVLESLTYSYLGDWITRQRDGVQRGEGGAEDRLAAALELQRRLAAILEGEPPFDIFVRWKPLAQQPTGWEPDINDGVRLNIRPFMATDLPGGKKGAGIMRAKPNLHWRKDRGKEPLTLSQRSKPPWLQDDGGDPDDDRELRPRDDYPWFWRYGEFIGDRVNDIHLTITEKQTAIPADIL